MKQLSINWESLRKHFSDQDYIDQQKKQKDQDIRLEQMEELIRVYNSISRKKRK